MRRIASEYFRALGRPVPLKVREFRAEDGHVIEGVLTEPGGYWYPIIDGVPVFLRGGLRPDFEAFRARHGLGNVQEGAATADVEGQRLTSETFSDKWRRFAEYGMKPSHQEFLFSWYCTKLGLSGIEELKAFYRSKAMILEAGPGSGFNSKFMAENCQGQVFAVDISEAAYVCFENTKHLENCHVIRADLMDLPFEDSTFDFIIADGVLHHTPDTRQAVFELYRKLKPGGRFFFYVYRKMGPVREFCDEHIRKSFTQLTPEECYKACEALTDLGRELSNLNVKITLDKPIEVLGVPSGTHDVQRLFYYNIAKCFWNDAFDYETNNMVNFDWYHPHTAWHHTEQEVKEWLNELGVKDCQFNPSNPNGISVLLTKPPA